MVLYYRYAVLGTVRTIKRWLDRLVAKSFEMFIAYAHASSQATVLLTFHSTIILAYDDDFHE